MTDGNRLVQLVYAANNTIRDCEHFKSKKLIRQFLHSFRNSIHSRRKTNPVQNLDGQPLPPYYEKWFSMHKLKHRCNKLHKTVKKMTKRVPNIHDNLIDIPNRPTETHYDWKFINSKHKHAHKYMRENTTVPKYLIESPSATSEGGVSFEIPRLPSGIVSKAEMVTKKTMNSFHNKSISSPKEMATVTRKPVLNTTSNYNTSHRPTIHLSNVNSGHSNHPGKCRRRKNKCSRKLNAKDHLTMKNGSHKNAMKGHKNELVSNSNDIDDYNKIKVPLLKTSLEDFSTRQSYDAISTTQKPLVKNVTEVSTIHQSLSNENCTVNFTIKTKGKHVFLNISKPNHHTRIFPEPTDRKTTPATTVTTAKVNSRGNETIENNTTTPIENVKIRHHHKQNRHFKGKKRKKNGKKKFNNKTKNNVISDVNNVTRPSSKPISVNSINSTSSQNIFEHVHSDNNSHSQLDLTTPVTNSIQNNQSETVTSEQSVGTIDSSNGIMNVNKNLTKTDANSPNDLTEESSQHNVNRISAESNRSKVKQEPMHVYRNLTAEKSMSTLDRLKLGLSNLMLVPGTKWCGYGNGATGFTDLGSFSSTDLCCRRHDSCQYTIPGFSWRYKYFNMKPFTLSHCTCDQSLSRNSYERQSIQKLLRTSVYPETPMNVISLSRNSYERQSIQKLL
ncbi:hypothetical protein M8J75_014461 [Diaphorina citri]|nr:hypothetical protein M8J75_014461 [Diaphorina citri]